MRLFFTPPINHFDFHSNPKISWIAMWSSHSTPSSTSFQLLPFARNLSIKGINVFCELSRKSAYSDKRARELAAFFVLSASICTILLLVLPFKYFHLLSFILHFSCTSGPVSYQQKCSSFLIKRYHSDLSNSVILLSSMHTSLKDWKFYSSYDFIDILRLGMLIFFYFVDLFMYSWLN